MYKNQIVVQYKILPKIKWVWVDDKQKYKTDEMAAA